MSLALYGMVAPLRAQDQTGESPPIPVESPAKWFTRADYPKDAKHAKRDGRVVAQLTVDANGAVTGCLVRLSSGSASLDAGTCVLARARGRFIPAHDEKGAAIAGTFQLPVVWSLGKREIVKGPIEVSEASLETDVIAADITVGADGRVERCIVTEGILTLFNPCTALKVGQVLGPMYVRNGKPVRSHVIRRYTTQTIVD